MRFVFIALLSYFILAGCVGANAGASTATATANQPNIPAPVGVKRDLPAAAARAPVSERGLEAVIGKDSAALIRLFGEPRLNVQEANGRKLQFVGAACVLDIYLYPEGAGGTEIATHIDGRRRDGAEVDRAACVNALIKR